MSPCRPPSPPQLLSSTPHDAEAGNQTPQPLPRDAPRVLPATTALTAMLFASTGRNKHVAPSEFQRPVCRSPVPRPRFEAKQAHTPAAKATQTLRSEPMTDAELAFREHIPRLEHETRRRRRELKRERLELVLTSLAAFASRHYETYAAIAAAIERDS